MEQVEQYALQRNLALWSALGQMLEERVFPGRAEAALSAFHRMITELASQVDARPIADSLRDLMDRTGYRKMLEEENTEEAKTRLANLDELLNAAVDAGERGEIDPRFSGSCGAGGRRGFDRRAVACVAADDA